MRIGKPIIIVGAITVIFGIIFHLQGKSIVGPESSFMYANPDWINFGIQIVVFGMIIMSTGIGLIVAQRINR